MSLNSHQPFQLSATYRLQWEKAQDMFVLLYPEGLVELSQSSAEILQLCEQQHTLTEMVDILETKFETTGLKSDISNFLTTAIHHGWITQSA